MGHMLILGCVVKSKKIQNTVSRFSLTNCLNCIATTGYEKKILPKMEPMEEDGINSWYAEHYNKYDGDPFSVTKLTQIPVTSSRRDQQTKA